MKKIIIGTIVELIIVVAFSVTIYIFSTGDTSPGNIIAGVIMLIITLTPFLIIHARRNAEKIAEAHSRAEWSN